MEFAALDAAKPNVDDHAAFVAPDVVTVDSSEPVSYVLDSAAEEPLMEAKGW